MENNMSLFTLVTDAGLIVQIVMLILLVLAFIAWYLIFKRGQYLRTVQKQMNNFESIFSNNDNIVEIYKATEKDADIGMQKIFIEGFRSYIHAKKTSATPQMILSSASRAMRIEMLKEEERLQEGLPLLAIIGSASPYIGLFGTVFGIMNAFMSLTGTQSTLQSVAPGIAEALVATAMGLFAAIPAVIAYNRFAALSEKLQHRNRTFAESFYGLLHKDVH